MQRANKIVSLLFAALGWFAIIAQFVLMLNNRTTSIEETTIRFFSYFTILTNIITALFFTSQAWGKKRFKPGTATAITVYITVVGLVYQIVLRQLWTPTGLQKIVDELLHSVIPVLTIVYWFRYEDRHNVSYKQIAGWLTYPLVYLAYILIRGSFSGFYPYPFISVPELGMSKVLFNAAFLCIVFVSLSFLYVFAGKKISIFLFYLALLLIPSLAAGQISYGDNPASGHYCHTRGITIYYEEYGYGRPLLLLHGNGGSIANMKGIIPFFSRYYRVIAVDTRGHGKSADPADSLSFEMIADDFNALLDSLHTGAADCIGWSDGGIDGLALAMRHPEKIRKLAVTGANIFVDSTALPASSIEEARAFSRQQHAKANLTADEKRQLKYNDLDLYEPRWRPADLQRVKNPTLVIGGDHDLIPVPHTVLIWQSLPHAWLWIVPNSGHGTLIEHKTAFQQNVLEFFQKW